MVDKLVLKQSIYSITKTTGEDVVHFETDDAMVKVIKADGTAVGTLKELIFKGKTVTSGSVYDIKTSGMYAVTNLTDMPAGYAVGKTGILSVSAIGEIGAPTLVLYQLSSQDGETFINVNNNGVKTGWSSGGVNIENALTAIEASVGDLSNLQTVSKSTLVGAINNVLSESMQNTSAITNVVEDYNNFKGHNHDEKYLSKSGDTVTGDLFVRNGNAFRSKTTTGTSIDLVKVDAEGSVIVGGSNAPMKILSSSDVTLNGRKIWTDGNHGNGSGLDADKLGGYNSILYARTNKSNVFAGNQTLTDELVLSNPDSTKSTKIVWKDGATVRGSVGFAQNGDFTIKTLSSSIVAKANGDIETEGSLVISSESKWNNLRFRRFNNQLGVGFELDRNSQDLILHDWESGRNGFTFVKETGEVSFQRQIRVSGRALYMQGNTPTGNLSVGDIWIG